MPVLWRSGAAARLSCLHIPVETGTPPFRNPRDEPPRHLLLYTKFGRLASLFLSCTKKSAACFRRRTLSPPLTGEACHQSAPPCLRGGADWDILRPTERGERFHRRAWLRGQRRNPGTASYGDYSAFSICVSGGASCFVPLRYPFSSTVRTNWFVPLSD